MDSELHFQFGPQDDTWVDLPDDLVQRLWDLCKAVAAGHESAFLAAEATHLKAEIDALLMDVVNYDQATTDGEGDK